MTEVWALAALWLGLALFAGLRSNLLKAATALPFPGRPAGLAIYRVRLLVKGFDLETGNGKIL